MGIPVRGGKAFPAGGNGWPAGSLCRVSRASVHGALREVARILLESLC